jgi:hypothetical protein
VITVPLPRTVKARSTHSRTGASTSGLGRPRHEPVERRPQVVQAGAGGAGDGHGLHGPEAGAADLLQRLRRRPDPGRPGRCG